MELFLKAHPDWSYLKWRHAFQYRLSVHRRFSGFVITAILPKKTVHGLLLILHYR